MESKLEDGKFYWLRIISDNLTGQYSGDITVGCYDAIEQHWQIVGSNQWLTSENFEIVGMVSAEI